MIYELRCRWSQTSGSIGNPRGQLIELQSGHHRHEQLAEGGSADHIPNEGAHLAVTGERGEGHPARPALDPEQLAEGQLLHAVHDIRFRGRSVRPTDPQTLPIQGLTDVNCHLLRVLPIVLLSVEAVHGIHSLDLAD